MVRVAPKANPTISTPLEVPPGLVALVKGKAKTPGAPPFGRASFTSDPYSASSPVYSPQPARSSGERPRPTSQVPKARVPPPPPFQPTGQPQDQEVLETARLAQWRQRVLSQESEEEISERNWYQDEYPSPRETGLSEAEADQLCVPINCRAQPMIL